MKVVAVASSPSVQEMLKRQLSELDFVSLQGVCIELSDAVPLCQNTGPDVIIVDTTGREIEAGLFIQAIGMNPESPCVVYALHREMEIGIFKEAVRKGAAEFIQYPDDASDLELALRKHATLLSRMAALHQGKAQTPQVLPHEVNSQRGRIVAAFAAKGGVGASTVALNLAHIVNH